MSPRRRSKNIRVPNLYERNGYYSWRNPITREEFGLGRDRASAIAQAVEANVHIAGLGEQPRLVDRLTGDSDRTVGKWNERYLELLGKQDFAEVTLRTYRSLGKRMVRMLGEKTPLARVTALEASGVIEKTAVTEGKARTAQALRIFMRDSFREARVQGWYAGDNPVMDTKLSLAVEVKRARFTWETFQRVYAGIELEWLRNAVDLALISGQRREDITAAQFKDFHDGAWWCQQRSEKSDNPHRIVIPLELRLDCFGKSLGDVLSQCRRSGVVSKHLIHQTANRGNSPVGRHIWMDTLSKRFADAVAASGIDWAPKEPPTFHELRSLAERLYAAQGGVNTQELLGHTDPETTALYHDSRGADWVRIKVSG